MRPRLALLSLGAALALGPSCSRNAVQQSVGPPDLPASLAEAGALVRQDIEERHRALAEAFGDPGSDSALVAAKLGDVGISLLAHGYLSEAAAAFRGARRHQPQVFRWAYYQARTLWRLGEMDEASRMFRVALELEPESLPAMLWLAETLLHRERLDAAEAAFRQALERRPDCEQAWAGLGRIELSRAHYRQAVEHLERALEYAPEAPTARYALALAYRGLGRLEDARQHLGRLSGENHALVRTCFEDPLMIEVKSRKLGALEHDGRAAKALEEGNLATALVELRQVMDVDPRQFWARYDIAETLRRMNRPEEARREVELLLAQAPDHAPALTLLGLLAWKEGDPEKAEPLYRRALAIDPEYEQGYLRLADLLRRTDRCAEALEAFADVLARAPDAVPAVVGKALCLGRLGQRAEALTFLDRSRQQLPDRVELALLSARLELQDPSTRPADAAALRDRVAEILDQQPSAFVAEALALAEAALGRWDRAVDLQQRALTAVGDRPGLKDRRTLILERLRSYQRAETPAMELAEVEVEVLSNLTADLHLSPRAADGRGAGSAGTKLGERG